MNSELSTIYAHLFSFFIFSLLTLVIFWFAWSKSFFSLPHSHHPTPKIKHIDLFFNFFVFIAVYIFLAPHLFYGFYAAFDHQLENHTILSLIQLTVFLFTALLLFIYALFQNRPIQKKIWKDYSFPNNKDLPRLFNYNSMKITKPITFDISFGVLTWLVAIPSVMAISNLLDAISLFLFGPNNILQLSVQYLISSLASPFSFIIAFFSVLIAAPLLEEFLFRGILLSWLRNKISPLPAFCLSSLLFAFFHYAPSQGPTNLTLIPTLFVFSMFLCFTYEKTRSLFSNIFLHSTFNLISALRIILFE